VPKIGRGDVPYLAFLTLFAFAVCWEVFTYNSFGPETSLYYFYSDGLSFGQALRNFTYFNLMWYRPIPAVLYWMGEQFVSWHNVAGWKFVHFLTVLPALYAIYWLVVTCLAGKRIAGLLAALWFIAVPNVFPGIMEAVGFDFLHICFAVLCFGLYLRGTQSSGVRTAVLTALAWLCFMVALCCKEAALTVPLFLVAVSALVLLLDAKYRPLWYREVLRLAPFLAVLPVYYFVHYTKVPAGSFNQSGPYRSAANWAMIVANTRKLTLWVMRIYAFTGDTLGERMYHSNAVNNTVGFAAAALVIAMWLPRVWRDRWWRLVALFLIAWIAVFLVLPIYGGGFLWHVNLPLVGYAVLFGLAAAWAWETLTPMWQKLSLVVFFCGLMALGRASLHVEVYQGTHALAFRINHSVLSNPPVPAERVGADPLIYIEDRLGVGGWWYGCFGSLFNYTYMRHDITEVIVPPMASVPENLRARWRAHPNAFFFRLDDHFDWHDASAEFRAAISR